MTRTTQIDPSVADSLALEDVLVCDINLNAQHNSIYQQELSRIPQKSLSLSDEEEQLAVVACCNGSSIHEIARQLKRSTRTIRTHLSHLGLLTSLDGNNEIPRVMVNTLK